ncbi:sensor protein FixL [mine drainage metagenome]|uniref:Sensor protein FixL n=1 Tax=mine drainage metagenome TaxID=410659 RepID=A0A1J5RTX3_9ZZZZ
MDGDIQEQVLPLWADVAFIARCARRYADLFGEDSAEPAAARTAVTEAVRLAEARASRGGSQSLDDGCLELEGQFFDHYDICSIYAALDSYTVAARNTLDEQNGDSVTEPPTRRILTAICLASSALAAAFPEEVGESAPRDHKKVIDWAVFGEPELRSCIEADLSHVERLSLQEGWGNETGVPPNAFGPLWPQGRPSTWPAPRLTFRPRARIIRTIGDRLISGPEAAVIELVKNSYDADAKKVRITFFPPLRAGQGEILFEDDGHGMSLSDIQEKWMEPATSDKKDRRESPKGRKLLGSKGIGRFAAARLGGYLELISTAQTQPPQAPGLYEKTRIAELDWNIFDKARYLDDVAFSVETTVTQGPTATILRIFSLRDDWAEEAITRLHHELRRLVSPSESKEGEPFKIVLDLSRCNKENSGFDGSSFVELSGGEEQGGKVSDEPYEVRPFPVLEACDYAVDGIFDESGTFEGTMTIRRAGKEAEPIRLTVPLKEGEDPCGIVLVRLNIFDREATSIRSTAEKAGFGHLGVREARKLLDSIAGVAIYREGFRVRPYGDAENDWLTLDAKRVQNPSLKIGRNQVAGTVVVDDEDASQLMERSSREGLEENGSFRRLQSLILTLLAEVIEPRRRKFRIAAGLDARKQSGFREVLNQAELSWAKKLFEKLPEGERDEAQKVISRESERLTGYLKDLEERQAQLEAQVTLGTIIGEVMHQGNTPLAFIETEVARLQKWWPALFNDTPEAQEDRADVPKILNGMRGSAMSLRELFNALRPLAGARRGEPKIYFVKQVVDNTIYLFRTKADAIGLQFQVGQETSALTVKGYPEDLATALTNLIDNAMYWLQHRSIQSPHITITASDAQSEKVTLFVQDNGHGVPEEFQDQLFDIGFTLKPSGTGLGLSIAREAIFRSGGELRLADSDVGARFAITLPRN